MKPINWEVIAQQGEARAGILRTRRSVIETPVFMPVGTQGTVKGVRFEWLEDEMDARIILGNTYHLFLRPGADLIREFGGLHKYTTWNRSQLTEEGVEFRSHLDGDKKFISPEVSMEIQSALGSEIVMVFDECPPGDAGIDVTRKSLEMTARWAVRSKNRFNELQDEGLDTGFVPEPSAVADGLSVENRELNMSGSIVSNQPSATADGSDLSGRQALFGIIQGAGHLDLRKESLGRTIEIGFDGYAIGGLSVGEEKSVMYEVIDYLAPQMPFDAPRYLMGVGTPEDLIEAVYRGVDMFDCVMPTRNGRTGSAFTSYGKINIRNARFAKDDAPMDENCPCSVCRRYSRAYLRHLYQTKEMLAATLLSHHNLAFFLDLMRQVRQSIKSGSFNKFRQTFLEKIKESEAEDK